MPYAIAAAVIAGGAAIYSANKSSSASEDASQAQQDSAAAANQTQSSMYNQTRADQAPWRAAGVNALNTLQQFYGIGGTPQPIQPVGHPANGVDYSSGYAIGPDGSISQRFTDGGQPGAQPGTQDQSAPDFSKIIANTPGYQFQFQQGQDALNSNLSARGLLGSGAAGKALTQYGQGVASQYVGQYVNGLQSLAGLGQTSTQATGQAGMNAANQIGSNQIYAGNAQATGYANQANAINQGLNGVVQAYGAYQGSRQNNQGQGSYDYGSGSNSLGSYLNQDNGGYVYTGLGSP